jgi:hypothetical protein
MQETILQLLLRLWVFVRRFWWVYMHVVKLHIHHGGVRQSNSESTNTVGVKLHREFSRLSQHFSLNTLRHAFIYPNCMLMRCVCVCVCVCVCRDMKYYRHHHHHHHHRHHQRASFTSSPKSAHVCVSLAPSGWLFLCDLTLRPLSQN